MNFSTEQIERVVREVLSEMKSPSAGRTNEASRAVPGPGNKPEAPPVGRAKLPAPDQDGVLAIGSRVVTLAEVTDRLSGKRRLLVRPGAIVTPAVRDALRQRNIVLEFTSAAVAGNPASVRLVLIAALTRFDVQSLAATLGGDGLKPVCHLRDCLLAATDLLVEELTGGNALAVVLTPYTAAALCLANRRPGVRAVLGEDVRALPKDLEAVGANTLIVNPKRVGRYALQQMAQAFGAGGVRSCPKVFVKHLS